MAYYTTDCTTSDNKATKLQRLQSELVLKPHQATITAGSVNTGLEVVQHLVKASP